ncbi:MAG TPA: hypothetical protein VJM80_06320 [bacterium]|nr:hypothetical protein [bacterium]
MEYVALLLSIISLVVAILAYARTGGIKEVKAQVSSLGTSVESVREKTADALGKVEKLIRGSEKT